MRSGNRPMRRLLMLIFLNMAYSTADLCIGLLSGHVGMNSLLSDAFHLTFECGLLTFSLFAMDASRTKPDRHYSYGHYLIVSAVTNLLVNLVGVWFFQNYARINLGKDYSLAFSSHITRWIGAYIDFKCLILAFWLLTLGVKNAEVLCLGLVSVTVSMLVMPLFTMTGGILLQTAPPSIPPSALSKCSRQVMSREDLSEVSQARFWELVPGHVVGSLLLQVKKGMDDCPILQYVHGFYHDLGVRDLTVQTDYA